jgi:3D (Asp-Asp-Asp) domain-containing protein
MQTNLVLSGNDNLSVSFDEESNSAEIQILRAFRITVIDANVKTEYEINRGTVADLLSREEIAVGENDIMSASMSDELYDAMRIVIDRVSYEEKVVSEIISCKTVKIETDELLKGETKTVTAGSDGIREVTTRLTYINGELVSSDRVGEVITTPVINRVVQVGTRAEKKESKTAAASNSMAKTPANISEPKSLTFTDSAGRTVSYTKKLTGKGTAYTAPVGAKTATGRVAEMGIVAVDPNVIPYGTRLYITSKDGRLVYGYALAADTGAALRRGDALVDVYYDSEARCRTFGRRDVVVYILD